MKKILRSVISLAVFAFSFTMMPKDAKASQQEVFNNLKKPLVLQHGKDLLKEKFSNFQQAWHSSHSSHVSHASHVSHVSHQSHYSSSW